MSKIDLNLDFNAIRKRIDEEKKDIKPSVWAKKVGVSRNVVTNIHGKVKQKPSLEYIVAVSIATDKSVEYYLWGRAPGSQQKIKSEPLPFPFENKPRANRIIQQLAHLEQSDLAKYSRAEGYIDALADTTPAATGSASTPIINQKNKTKTYGELK